MDTKMTNREMIKQLLQNKLSRTTYISMQPARNDPYQYLANVLRMVINGNKEFTAESLTAYTCKAEVIGQFMEICNEIDKENINLQDIPHLFKNISEDKFTQPEITRAKMIEILEAVTGKTLEQILIEGKKK